MNLVGGKGIILLLIPGESYTESVIDITKRISGRHAVFYINLNKTAETLRKSLGKSAKNTSFLDDVVGEESLPFMGSRGDDFLSTPNMLKHLAMSISVYQKKHPESVILLDSVSTLLVYHDSDDVAKFIHLLTKRIRKSNGTAVYTMLRADAGDPFMKRIEMIVDRVVDAPARRQKHQHQHAYTARDLIKRGLIRKG